MTGRRQKVWGIFVLMILLLTAVSCDRNSPTSGGTTDTGSNIDQVFSVDLTTVGDRNITNYIGKTDTITLRAKALNQGRVGVSGVPVEFEILEGPGDIARLDSTTNASGDITAKYTLQLTSVGTQTIRLQAKVGGLTDNIDLSIETREVNLTMTMTPQKDDVQPDTPGESNIRVIATDSETGVGVAGVPLRIQQTGALVYSYETNEWIPAPLNTIESILSPIDFSNQDGSDSTKLLVNDIEGPVRIVVTASVNVPLGKGVSGKSRDGLQRRGNKVDLNDAKNEMGIAGIGNEHFVSALQVQDTVEFFPFTGTVDSLYIWIEPNHLTVTNNVSATSTVHVVAYDDNNNGIRGLVFDWSLDDPEDGKAGVISQMSPTDSTGKATATIRTERQFGTWTVIARVAGIESAPATITVEEDSNSPDNYTLYMNVTTANNLNPPSIFADNGITRATVSAMVVDPSGYTVPYDTIRLAATGGAIQSTVITDSSGRAIVSFTDVGDTAVLVPVSITGRYINNGTILAAVTRQVIIRPVPEPNIAINVPFDSTQVSATDTVVVTAQLTRDNGQGGFEPVTPGTPVRINTTHGTVPIPLDSTDANGIARFAWRYGTVATRNAGVEVYTVQGGTVYSAIESVILKPGRANRIAALGAERYNMLYLDPLPNMVASVVVDTFGNRVDAGVSIRYEADKGTITQSVQTDNFGQAIATYRAGAVSGLAKIKSTLNIAVAESIWVNIASGNALSISMLANQNELQVAGTGGQETSIVTAQINDGSGNPVDQTWVYFLMADFPYDSTGVPPRIQPRLNQSDGTNSPFRHPIYGYGLPYDSTTTNQGLAQISVSSGTGKGQISIWAWVYQEDEDGNPRADSSRAVFNGIQVVAGPPADIEIDVNFVGTDVLGASWRLPVSARVQDARGNDVASGHSVVFGANNPEIHLEEGRTGNYNDAGDSTAGVAYSSLTYNSRMTNVEVTAYASVVGAGGEVFTDEFTFQLPIQEPRGILNTDLLNWNYTFRADDPAEFDMEVFVMDGHNHWVNGQLVHFSTSKGRYYSQGGPDDQDWVPAFEEEYEHTGEALREPGESVDGWADLWLVIRQAEAFTQPIPETTAQASAEIVGYADATIEPIVLNFYQVP
ncbi:Ig-like domain-containing protein [bacterium]|nr:Ig-like domain-containing protein [bacterium]